MGLIEDLGSQTGIHLEKIGGLELVDFDDTQTFLDAAQKAGYLVLGIEVFRLEGDQLRPDINAIADFSNMANFELSIIEARNFIEIVGQPGMLFDFTISKK